MRLLRETLIEPVVMADVLLAAALVLISHYSIGSWSLLPGVAVWACWYALRPHTRPVFVRSSESQKDSEAEEAR